MSVINSMPDSAICKQKLFYGLVLFCIVAFFFLLGYAPTTNLLYIKIDILKWNRIKIQPKQSYKIHNETDYRFFSKNQRELFIKSDVNSSDQFRPFFKYTNVNCAGIIQNDSSQIEYAESLQKNMSKWGSLDDWILEQTSNCSQFITERGYITSSVTMEEEDFPIAFSILMYKQSDMVERLLRAIYRPQNYYCIHVDEKAKSSVKKAVKSLVSCFHNVFISSRTVSVTWGTFSILEADLICMEDLLKFAKWKYFINLTGQEFPLKTNLELVKILKVFNGSNNVDARMTRQFWHRTKFVYKGNRHKTIQKKTPVPFNMTKAAGGLQIAAQRGFIDFIINDHHSKTFIEWLKDTNIPDESLFSTLNVNPEVGTPGAFFGCPRVNNKQNEFITRWKIMNFNRKYETCHGKFVHDVCIYGLRALPDLVKKPQMFVNKFHRDYHPLAYQCMEEWIINKTRAEIEGKSVFNTRWYENLEFIKLSKKWDE